MTSFTIKENRVLKWGETGKKTEGRPLPAFLPPDLVVRLSFLRRAD